MRVAGSAEPVLEQLHDALPIQGLSAHGSAGDARPSAGRAPCSAERRYSIAEATLQIALLALDHSTLHHDEHARQEHGRPERIRENRHPGVHEYEREIDRNAAEAIGPRSHDRCWAINSRSRDARRGRREQRKIREVWVECPCYLG
jgi:hypothetical protein